MQAHSFPPVADAASSVLVLGSMPGKESLRAGQYYANPRNAFWKIMGALLEFEPDAPYAERLEHLLRERIAVWDVLDTCTRASSLDSDIVDATSEVNDFPGFFKDHPSVSAVFFNGTKAEAVFKKRVAPRLPASLALQFRRLPSTSPANASIPYGRKLEEWGSVAHRAQQATADAARRSIRRP